MALLIAALIPVVVFLFLIYRKDTVKEPKKLLLKCFIWGIVSAVPAIFLASILESEFAYGNNFIDSFDQAFFGAAIPEELMKFILLYWLIWKNKEFNQHYDGIIYAVFISLGFAAIENVMYVMDEEDGGYEVAFMRAILSVPGHGFWGVAMGYFFSLAKFSTGIKRTKNLVSSLCVPILLHGTFNFLIFYGIGMLNETMSVFIMLLFVVFVIYFWRLGIRKIKKHIEKDEEMLKENELF